MKVFVLAHLKAQARRYQRGETVFCADQKSHRFIVLQGSVHVEECDAQGTFLLWARFMWADVRPYAVLNVPLTTVS